MWMYQLEAEENAGKQRADLAKHVGKYVSLFLVARIVSIVLN